MIDTDKPRDQAAEHELNRVPEEFLDKADDAGEDTLGEALAALRRDLEAAKQEVLYAQAETQNVRRRLEREKDEARADVPCGTQVVESILVATNELFRAALKRGRIDGLIGHAVR